MEGLARVLDLGGELAVRLAGAVLVGGARRLARQLGGARHLGGARRGGDHRAEVAGERVAGRAVGGARAGREGRRLVGRVVRDHQHGAGCMHVLGLGLRDGRRLDLGGRGGRVERGGAGCLSEKAWLTSASSLSASSGVRTESSILRKPRSYSSPSSALGVLCAGASGVSTSGVLGVFSATSTSSTVKAGGAWTCSRSRR
mmetsp:Transcript_27169/g.68611  ORF Transcript_27169/g.68611 Transcript_27169/m.68611 type:complete len:200 (+) Transcript_27169:252-851(+)